MGRCGELGFRTSARGWAGGPRVWLKRPPRWSWMPGGPAARALLRLAVTALLAVRERSPPAPAAPCAAELRCECACACGADRRELGAFAVGLVVGAALVLAGVAASRPARVSPALPAASPPPPPAEAVVRYRPRHVRGGALGGAYTGGTD